MTRRRLLLIATLPLAVAVILGMLALLPPRPGVTKANLDQIKKGMTMAEVEELLHKRQNFDRMVHGWSPKSRVAYWSFRNDDGSGVAITYMSLPNSGGWSEYTVNEMSWKDEADEEDFLDRLLRWLHLD